MKIPAAASGRRIFRRHTETDAIDAKRRKQISRRSRLASYTRSLSRFSTFNSIGDYEEAQDATTLSDATSTSLTSVEEFTSGDGTTKLASVDIQEEDSNDGGDGRNESDRDGCNGEDREEEKGENFFSRILDLIPCIPWHELAGEPQQEDEIEANGYEGIMMKIECILNETIDEEADECEHSLKDTTHLPGSDELLSAPTWSHEPLLLIATPGSGMRVHRIRSVAEPSYFECLASTSEPSHPFQLPINNGREHPSHTQVIDFESPLFAGTALLRIRNATKKQALTASEEHSDSTTTHHDYFGKHARKFQLVIRGKFKSPDVAMSDCISGMILDHSLATSKSANSNCVENAVIQCRSEADSKYASRDKRRPMRPSKKGSSSADDSLPPKWALRAAVKVASVFSPQIDADLDCANPRVFSPLCSTAQTISVCRDEGNKGAMTRLEETQVEPCCRSDESIVSDLKQTSFNSCSTAGDNVQQRKRVFNAVHDAFAGSQSSLSPCFDSDAIYTFEFLQHLVDYNDLSLDLGKVLGKVRLGGALRGQPIRFISATVKTSSRSSTDEQVKMQDLECLWSFDLWHRSLLR